MKKQKAPGKSYRKGMTIKELIDMFPNDRSSEIWFTKERWPNGVCCSHCGSLKISHVSHPTMPYRCKDCRKHFSVRTGTVMQSSKIGYQSWAISIYLFTTGIKGISSMKLHRDLGITQKSAWFMAHRLRRTLQDDNRPFYRQHLHRRAELLRSPCTFGIGALLSYSASFPWANFALASVSRIK